MKVKIIILIIFLNFLMLPNTLISQVLDSEWKKGVLLFEVKTDKESYKAIGTGFVVLYKQVPFIVTNKHIANNKGLFLRFNLKSKVKPSLRCCVDSLISLSTLDWGLAQSADIAVFPLFVFNELYKDSLNFKSFGVSLIKGWDFVNEGDDIYVLGFPLRIGSGEFYSPVVRSGIIALKEKRGEFLIDSNMFPGNSGGPVFLKSFIFDYRNSTFGKVNPCYLIGIVSSSISYTDVAMSVQTGRPRVTFEENSGLALVFSADQIIGLLEHYLEKYKL